MEENFRGFVVREQGDGTFTCGIENRTLDDLPAGDVLIRVHYAGLNYKDALSTSGHKGITKRYPHTPGVDASGIVVSSSNSDFLPGQEVLVTSYDLGMNTSGGFGEYIRVPSAWVIPLPEGISLRSSMILGTAAYTAALALYKMQLNGQDPEMGNVVVTGATGGVGSMAVAILAKAGYKVVAATGKPEEYDYLRKLGASKFLTRDDMNDPSEKPLLSPAWAGAIDTIGGTTLETLLKKCARNGNIAACGLVLSPFFSTSVYPFILNGVNLLGIDSAETPTNLRKQIWNMLAKKWNLDDLLEEIVTEIKLEDLKDYISEMLAGESRGRVIVRHEL